MGWTMKIKIPKAPSWTVVCLFGAVWNAVVERSWWASLVCVGLALALPFIDRLDRKLLG